MNTTQVIEISRQVYAISYDGHLLRQHYFTLQSAQTAARGLGR